MRNYSYKNKWEKLLIPEIVSLLTQIHEYKGEQISLLKTKNDILAWLMEAAGMQSIEASNKMEEIYTSDERLKSLVRNKTFPRTRDEQAIAGYRDVLAIIHENYEFIPVKPSIILQLHRDLYKFSSKMVGGVYKESDKIEVEAERRNNLFERARTVSEKEVPDAMAALCTAFDEISDQADADPLLLIPMFILDFLCICPFYNGNEQMSFLLMLLLLHRAGYIVGKYVSIEKMIEQSKVAYYKVLQDSSENWQEEKNDYIPFVRYMLGIVAAAYRKFSLEVRQLSASNLSKPERIREMIRSTGGQITKSEIMGECPDISQITVQRALNDLLKNNEIIKLSGGRYTSYRWNHNKENEQ